MNIRQSKHHPLIIAILVLSLIISAPTSALSETDLRTYAKNSINIYSPCGDDTSLYSGSVEVSGSNAKEKVWSALKSLGLSDEIAAGILGNIENEGSISPVRYEESYRDSWANGSYDWENNPKESRGVGLIQWSFNRRVNLFKYLRENGGSDLVDKYLKHPEKYGHMSGDQFIAAVDSDEDANRLYGLEIEFLLHEIENNSRYKGVLDQTSVKAAAEYFTIHVEGCGACQAGSSETRERIAAAEKEFQTYAGQSSFAGGGSMGYGNADCGCLTMEGSSVSSNITWTDDGWIAGGIEGYVKSPVEGTSYLNDWGGAQPFATQMPNGKGPGPNKITLHSTEGTNIGGGDPRRLFSGYPPHFTIDLKEKRVFQHFPITKTSAAVASYDNIAGIQIEIFGYSDASLASSRGQNKWILSSFSNSEVSYLAELLKGISKATGIPLTSTVDWSGGRSTKRLSVNDFKKYEGILGHRNVPDNDHWDPDGIWDKLQTVLNAASSILPTGLSSSTSDASDTPITQIEDKGKNVTIIGDSITNRTKQSGAFKNQFENANIMAQDSKKLTNGSALNRSGDAVVTELIKNKRLTSIVVIALGTNDGTITKDTVQKIVDTINKDGTHTIVFVNNYGYGRADGQDYSANNQVFNAIKNTNPNVIIADWASAAKSDPNKYIDTSDSLGVHPTTPDGTKLFASTIYDAITKNYTATTAYGEECMVDTAPDSDVQALQDTVVAFAWPDYHKSGYVKKKSEYEEALKQGGYHGAGCHGGGVDCGGFVYQVMSKSGWDPDFGGGTGYTYAVKGYFNKAGSSKWKNVTSEIKSNADAMPGDVILSDNHILLYVGEIPGFHSVMASASMCDRAPMADHAKDISNYTKQGYKIWRRI